MKNGKIIWSDVASVCGIQLPFIKYQMTQDRIYTTRGIVALQEEEILLYRILDISLTIGLIERLTKTGTITLHTNDVSCSKLILSGIKNPREVRKMISEAVEGARIETGVRGKEMFGAEFK
ncbi:MAG: PH domain-containing protein [Thermotaleaceae bacterium]